MKKQTQDLYCISQMQLSLKGHRRITICTREADVILAIANTCKFPQGTQVWLAPGSIAGQEVAEPLCEG